jgi:parvulin-like peptidyl-prolyl isomerase
MRNVSRNLFHSLALCALLLPISSSLYSQNKPADRVLAIVDEEPVLASDIDQVIGLGLAEKQAGESQSDFRHRVLEQLIDQKLRFHEIDRYGFTEIPVEQVDDHVKKIRARFPSDAAFQQRLRELGLDEESLKALVARQLLVLTYVDERLGPRVFISLDDIRNYYDDVLVPKMKAEKQPVPPIEDVREDIRDVLKQQRLNQELDRWTEELRRKADVVDYSQTEHGKLPPVVMEKKEDSE